MLLEISISNFAIIEQQSVTFGPGLNVVSGETGAGKSILLHAIELLLGGRPRPHVLRTGADSAVVEALFSLDSLPEHIRRSLPDIIEGDELVLSRSISASGRNKVYINGKLGSVTLLEEVVSKIINICGQNSHVKLLNPSFHRELLDGFAENEALLIRYTEAFELWHSSSEKLRQFEDGIQKSVLRRAELEFIVEELGAFALRPGIRGALEAEIKKLSHSESLLRGIQGIENILDADEGLFTSLHRVSGMIGDLERIDPAVSQLRAVFDSGERELTEFERELKRYAGRIDVNESRIAELREELAEVARLERKYRCDDSTLCELLQKSRSELSMVDGSLSVDTLRTEVERNRIAVEQLAGELTKRRLAASKTLSKNVERELSEVSMPGVSLTLSHVEKNLGADGKDQLEFLIATNKGEEAKPLRQVASGGELSRIMLVLKKVLRERTGVNVLVFDEVDTGISGAVARAVGEKLRALSEGSQVLCITHLPQVASLADHHILVEKSEVKVGREIRTVSTIRVLEQKDRIDEIARMLSGKEITVASKESALELLGARNTTR